MSRESAFSVPLRSLLEAKALADQILHMPVLPAPEFNDWIALRQRAVILSGVLGHHVERVTRTVEVEVTEREAL